jgi:hypothetical protein
MRTPDGVSITACIESAIAGTTISPSGCNRVLDVLLLDVFVSASPIIRRAHKHAAVSL